MFVFRFLLKWHQYEPELVTKPIGKSSTNKTSAASKIRLELIQKHVATEVFAIDSVEGNIHREYLKYCAVSDVMDDPLAWWRAHKDSLPYLSALARVMLAIPGSSGATEYPFSESGSLITKKKAVEKIMFVHNNLKHIKDSHWDWAL